MASILLAIKSKHGSLSQEMRIFALLRAQGHGRQILMSLVPQ
jgi:hypothetical protein